MIVKILKKRRNKLKCVLVSALSFGFGENTAEPTKPKTNF